MIFILNYTIRDMNWLKFYKLIKIMEKKYYIIRSKGMETLINAI